MSWTADADADADADPQVNMMGAQVVQGCHLLSFGDWERGKDRERDRDSERDRQWLRKRQWQRQTDIGGRGRGMDCGASDEG